MFSSLPRWSLLAIFACLISIVRPALADDAGQEDLDEAVRLKVAVESIEDLGKVIDKLDSAIEKGLEKDNADSAKQMLMSTLMQRASAFSQAIFSVPMQDARAGVQIMRLRQFAAQRFTASCRHRRNNLGCLHHDGPAAWVALGRPERGPPRFQRCDRRERRSRRRPRQALALRSGVQRDPERQAEDLDRAIELQPKTPDYYRLAQFRQTKEKFSDALTDIDKALELDNEHAASYELRGMILLGMERY